MDDLIHSSKFKARVEELMRKHETPGLTIAITHDGVDSSVAFGYASLDPKAECEVDTLFDIASASKSLTAAAVGLLVDDEKYPEVKYEAKMKDLLPEDFVMSEGYEGVTVEDILSHRSGMANHDSSYLGINAAKPDTPRSVTRNLRNLEPAAPIRSEHIYCNMMYTVATHLVEVQSGVSFSEFLEERVFKKLGMSSTSLQPSRAKAKGQGKRMARGYVWDKDTDAYCGFEALESPEAQGAGSIITSALDYLKWVRALMNHEEPITEEVYKGLTKARSLRETHLEKPKKLMSTVVYAAGLEVQYYRGYQVIGHDGSVSGFGSSHFWVPLLKLGGVVLGNGDEAGDIGDELMLEMIDELIGVPEGQRGSRADDEDEEKEDDDEDGSLEEAIERLYPDIEREEQKMPLELYTGEYWHPGYHGLRVEIRDGMLFSDANDRAFPLELSFTHVSGQTCYAMRERLGEAVGGTWGGTYGKAEFRWEGERVVKIGLDWEDRVEGGLTWFSKVSSGHAK